MKLISDSRFQRWLSPLVHLAHNWISRIGIFLVTAATIFWIFLLPTTMRGHASNPYMGLLTYMALPGAFFLGLGLIPLGIWWSKRRRRLAGLEPEPTLPLNFANPAFRSMAVFIIIASFANVIIGAQFTYSAVTYMESVSFCGLTCHVVMKPEFTAYQNSAHSRVECVTCHIGAGADWFVRSKISGIRQVFAVIGNYHPRPIPTPVHNLRPARETCETCHWPQRYGGDRLKVIPKFAEDEANTNSKTVMLLHVGGGNGAKGIHGTHMGPNIRIRYAPADDKRQTIPWVELRNAAGKVTEYTSTDAKAAMPGSLAVREMDCMDCHNRPAHSYEMPDGAVDRALAAGDVSPALPFAKKTSAAILKATYPTEAAAEAGIPAAFEAFYKEKYPDLYAKSRQDIQNSGKGVLGIFKRNVFPEMKVTWGAYPNNIGHNDFPGCFRCHDEQHVSKAGAKITQDCGTCHTMLAVEEAAPKILSDLGLDKKK